MARNGGAGAGFVAASAMLPGGSTFAPAGANAGVPPPAAALSANAAALPADAPPTASATDGAGVAARVAMRWTTNTSGFVLRRMSQLIKSGARANKGFKENEVNQVAKLLREYSGEKVTSTQVYNHLWKWRQRWGRICKLKDLSGALWDEDVKAIMLDPKHYIGHIKDHPKDAELLNTPLRFYDEMQTIFSNGMTTGRFAVGSNGPLGVNSYQADSGLGKVEGSYGNHAAREKIDQGEGSKATELLTFNGGRKRKRPYFSEEEVPTMTNMTDVVNNVANALRETGPAHVDADLYHAMMDMSGFSKQTRPPLFCSICYFIGATRDCYEKLPTTFQGSSHVQAAAFRLGQRVHAADDPGRVGTVRYLGPVEGHAGDWVGVDWDDGAGGRHDGSLAGRRYFVAAGECSASFARPTALSGGISLRDALRLRYRVQDFTKEEQDEMYVFSTSQKRVSVEFVGTDKVQEKLNNFNELTSASVSNMGVSSIGAPDELKSLVPNLRFLDLTGNLFSQWQVISSLCQALASLEVLNLTNNTMENDVAETPMLENIQLLVLNNCGVTWELIEKIKVSFSCISELHLMSNRFNMIMFGITPFEQKQVKAYVKYPSNLLPDGSLDDAAAVPFENLQVLLLGSNDIDDFSSVDSLLFPSLRDVRLSDNPIADPAKSGAPRFVLVARVGKVGILNGSEISPRERRESEILYVRLVMGKIESNDPEEIKRLHPRFAELKSFHGIEDEKPTSSTSGPQKMASGLISVTLKCVGPSMGEKQPLTKKLPATATGCPLPQLLEENTASLMELGIGSGATIVVDEES
ncbi:unnamed protein product [Miscanthus lutarioriparius]|uniref:CAP-Gly domain-containing protein n=1 Tax=Miscanthus lutarioriparius TaxID=422564 RepID=A0A811RXQ0_9POAL|nr:unnamed protein product [Miscanthus lutarioriparius]